ncbi:hypothetical protein TSOC_012170 [Tetrabaena socialis]|uniref:Uncharacterized protein n=1 Tax=Tetrabaena socialis TaxID=47790 RepID=A0A2J7ZNR0_9CHLO|nr:hypothetical protein TSOC_012170 [Tetrabaena socialis]|eukprot:PNH01902.1 hypothetical protein TSOC_012170 [Tetrabaena socialis]
MLGGGPYDIVLGPRSRATDPRATGYNERNFFAEVSALLEVRYLSDSNGEVEWPVKGILWGPASRPLICLPMRGRWRDKAVNVFFLVTTGAPRTEVSASVFTALGCEVIPAAATVDLGGVSGTKVQLCDQDISVLGTDFLSRNSCTLKVDYSEQTVTLQKHKV